MNRLQDDACALQARESMNARMADYYLTVPRNDAEMARKAAAMDQESALVRGAPDDDCPRERRQLITRTFEAAPSLHHGLMSGGVASRPQPNVGMDTSVIKRCARAPEMSTANFQFVCPQVVQNPDHIIPTAWIRGGAPSRDVNRCAGRS